jgi:hypothetical protein
VLLFQSKFHSGLVSGAITLTFRLWPKPRVKPGSRYRCHPIGVLVVDAVDRVRIAEITDREAEQAGFPDRRTLLTYLQGFSHTPLSGSTEVFKVSLHYGGEGDFAATAHEAEFTDEAFSQLSVRLARLDASSRSGPWTRQTLTLIESHPRTAASRLAGMISRETKPFKADVVKLKKLGLTQSFEVGYDLTPRGRSFLERLRSGRQAPRSS